MVAGRRTFPARAAATLAALAGVLLLAGPVAGAFAAERVVAIPQSTYATTNVAIDQGEPLTFLNLDALNHDVTARGKDASGKPLFSTPLIGPGQEVPVDGADRLSPGSYAFFCTVHPNMEGTLSVGGGGGGSGGGKDPSVAVDVLDSRISEVRKAGVLHVDVDVDRAAKMAMSASAKIDGERAKLGKASHDFPEEGSHLMEVKLSRSGKSALRGADKVKVTVTATAKDSSGNTGRGQDSATLR